MIFCKNCGYEGAYISRLCPVCKREVEIDDGDIAEIKHMIEIAEKQKEFETVIEGYHILADFGDTDGERGWAKLLEKGRDVKGDIDEAMKFYQRAAQKFDAYSAYRFSDLISRINKQASKFWLEFSAFLDCPRAYLDAAKSHAQSGECEFANHYAYLAATTDDVDAIVFIAERYFNGEGLEPNHEYAKWYLDKLKFSSLYSFKISFKLRSVKPVEAPNISLRDKKELAENLLGKARKLGLSHPIFYLTAYLFNKGDMSIGTELGDMYIRGYGTEKNTELGVKVLTRAAVTGNAKAYMSLGRLCYEGKHCERNLRLSVDYFDKAARLGIPEAYEILGDIYHNSDFEGWDIAKAAELYKKAADHGFDTAREKLKKITETREAFYEKAKKTELTSPEQSFKYRYAATAMGHVKAKLLLADAYAKGIGTKVDRPLAFSTYKSLAEAGLETAFFPLGLCYAYGFGTEFDFDKAVKTLCKADKFGIALARKEVKRLLENKKRALGKKFYSTAMRLIYKGRFDAARRYLEASSDLSYPKAIYTLGCLYDFGRGTAMDREKGALLYAKAEEMGFNDRRSEYKLKVLKMLKNANNN